MHGVLGFAESRCGMPSWHLGRAWASLGCTFSYARPRARLVDHETNLQICSVHATATMMCALAMSRVVSPAARVFHYACSLIHPTALSFEALGNIARVLSWHDSATGSPLHFRAVFVLGQRMRSWPTHVFEKETGHCTWDDAGVGSTSRLVQPVQSCGRRSALSPTRFPPRGLRLAHPSSEFLLVQPRCAARAS